jgi:H/ACA ribonucleoprotein complex non-core subunit NAF1
MEQPPGDAAPAAASNANAAVAALLRGGLTPPPVASVEEPTEAPQQPTDVERIAAQLGYDLCSDDSDDEACLSAPPDAQFAAWEREEAGLDAPATTAREVLELPPPPALKDLACGATLLRPVGCVEGFAEEGAALLIRGAADQKAVVEGTALFLADRRPLGVVAELFGPVAEPFYLLRLGAADAVLVQAYTTPGAVAHVPADRAAFVAPDALRSRGRDGGDESDPEQEFSDDEAQAAALGKVVI